MNVEMLRECFRQLRKDAAAGIDKVTKKEYGLSLEKNLAALVEGGRIHFIVDADIKGFFDNVDHEWLMKFLGHRIADKRVLRYVKRFLKAGIMENGAVSASDKGTPKVGYAKLCISRLMRS